MVNYIRAEFYKVLHRKYTYWFLLTMLAGAGLLVAGWVYTNANGNDIGFASGAGILSAILSVGVYCTLLTGDLVFSDQYKFNTLKNEVSYGIPRARIYLCKLFVSCVVALIACVIIVGFYVALCWVFLPHDPALDGEVMRHIGFTVLSALPLWLGSQAVSMLCLVLFKSSTVASFAFVGVAMLVPEALKLLAMLINPVFMKVREFLLTTPFETMGKVNDWSFFVLCLAIGAGWFAVSTLLGVIALNKREIS